MKEIRQLNKVVSTECRDIDEVNPTKLLRNFDSEPVYFREVIRPMLSPGHDNELVFWLRDLGLIKDQQQCRNVGINTHCSSMSWTTSHFLDGFQWKCNNCLAKKSIREDSIFENIKCNFTDAVRIILGWSKGEDFNSMASLLGIKRNVVEMLYKRVADVADKYMKAHIREWQIGGPGVIVLVDTYPEGCASRCNLNLTRFGRPILCISEVKSFPQKYWLELLHPHNNKTEHKNSTKEHILKVIEQIVKPGSVIVVPSEFFYCSYNDIASLKHLYPTIIDTTLLSRHNNGNQSLFANLEIIWKAVLDVCEEAQYYNSNYIQKFILGHMWRRFEDTSFEMLIYQIVA